MYRTCFAIATFLAAALDSSAAPPPAGYTAKANVAAPTRLDWTFVVTNRSLTEVPADLLKPGYDSTKQSYELYLPPRKDAKRPIPSILFVSAGDEPGGWKAFEPICTEKGIAFIGVRGAGNGIAGGERVRIILDCFDDVRRQVTLDPDRTYASGFSGGARIACGIAFALPEYFGGVLPVAASGDLRQEQWLRFRIADRLSAALLTGDGDFNRGELELWKGPMWKELGIRTRVWVQPKTGHALPPSTTLLEAIAWLDEGVSARAALAKKFPSSRAVSDATPARDAAAKALLKEGEDQLKSPASLYSGLMVVKGVSERWPDTASGKAARKRLEEFEAKAEKPWEVEDVTELRKQFAAEARALSDYVLKGIPVGSPYEKQRPEIAKQAAELWKALIADAPESDLAKEGKKRTAELAPLMEKK